MSRRPGPNESAAVVASIQDDSITSESEKMRITLHIAILRAEGLWSTFKGIQAPTTLVRVQSTLDTAHFDSVLCSASHSPEWNFTTSITVEIDSLQHLVEYPLLLSVIEVKEAAPPLKSSLGSAQAKRGSVSKGAKVTMATLGELRPDLSNLLFGTSSVSGTSSLTGSTRTCNTDDAITSPSQLSWLVTVDEPLVNDVHKLKEQGNLISVSLQNVYSLPEVWTSSRDHASYTYTATVHLLDHKRVVFEHGRIQPPLEPAQLQGGQQQQQATTSGAKKRHSMSNTTPTPATTTVPTTADPSYAVRYGDLRKRDAAFRIHAERHSHSVRFQHAIRVYLTASETDQLRIALLHARPVSITFARSPLLRGGDTAPWPALAKCTLHPLVTPGSSECSGAFFLRPRPTDSNDGAPATAPPPLVDMTSAYTERRTYLTVALALHHPLRPCRSPLQIQSVAHFIPPRPLFPRIGDLLDEARAQLKAQLRATIDLLVAEYASLTSGPHTMRMAPDEQRRRILYSLNTTGMAFAIKERLKPLIVQIVRERFLTTGEFTSDTDHEAFVAQLYVYLLDELHEALHEHFDIAQPQRVPAIPEHTDPDALLRFATQAEFLGDIDGAAAYHRRRIAQGPMVSAFHIDYGALLMRAGLVDTALVSFREAVALNQTQAAALVLVALATADSSNYDTSHGADTGAIPPTTTLALLQHAVEADPAHASLAHIALALTHTLDCNYVEEELALQRARRCLARLDSSTYTPSSKENESQSDGTVDYHVLHVDDKVSDDDDDDDDEHLRTGHVHLAAVPFFLDHGFYHLALRALAADRALCGPLPSQSKYRAQALLATGQLDEARRVLEDDLIDEDHHIGDSDVIVLLADVLYQSKDFPGALALYERVLSAIMPLDSTSILTSSHDGANDEQLQRALECVPVRLLVRLAHLYQTGRVTLPDGRIGAHRACDIYFLLALRSPSAYAWRGVGLAAFHLGNDSVAEDALAEANTLDNHDPITFAVLALICARHGRMFEFQQLRACADRLNLTDTHLIKQLQAVQASLSTVKN